MVAETDETAGERLTTVHTGPISVCIHLTAVFAMATQLPQSLCLLMSCKQLVVCYHICTDSIADQGMLVSSASDITLGLLHQLVLIHCRLRATVQGGHGERLCSL